MMRGTAKGAWSKGGNKGKGKGKGKGGGWNSNNQVGNQGNWQDGNQGYGGNRENFSFQYNPDNYLSKRKQKAGIFGQWIRGGKAKYS